MVKKTFKIRLFHCEGKLEYFKALNKALKYSNLPSQCLVWYGKGFASCFTLCFAISKRFTYDCDALILELFL